MEIDKFEVLDILKMLLVVFLATALAYAFDAYDFTIENILLIYVVADIIIVLETRKLAYGIVGGVINAIIYEFFFIAPRLSFGMEDISCMMSIMFYLAVCVVVSIMSYRLQAQIKKSETSEKLVKSTYDNSKGLLKARSPEEIANYEVKVLKDIINRPICICLKKRKNFIPYGDNITDVETYIDAFNYSLNYNIVCGYRGQKFTSLKFKIYPLKSTKTSYGVIIIDCSKGDIKRSQKEYLKTNITHIVMALEREKIQDQKEDVKEKIENVELKNALLLNVSSGLQEPVKEIAERTTKIIEECKELDKKGIIEEVKVINEQNEKLQQYVNHILDLSSKDSGEVVKNEKKVNLKKVVDATLEVFEDFKGRTINEEVEDVKVNVDQNLLQRAFENIVSNALEYTKENSTLNIRCYIVENDAVIEFEDNGGGIEEEKLETIFEPKQDGEERPDYKVGLSVCKKIIEAHGGKIKAFNNALGGLTIKITLKSVQ